jgi:ATP-dependent DNA ligase
MIKKQGKLYLANKPEHGRIRTEMPALLSVEADIPDDSVFLAELVWGAGKDFYDFARHKLDPECGLGIFSCLKYAGVQLWGVATHEETRRLLEKQTFYNDKVALVPCVEVADKGELNDLFKRIVKLGFEGLVAKQKTSKYVNGKTYEQTKWKNQAEGDFVICGYQTGTKRAKTLSVLIGHLVNGEVKILTHVGGGFKQEEKETMLQVLQGCKQIGRMKDDILVEPKIVIKVIHNGVIRNPDGSVNSLRHPRFDRVRFDKTVKEIEALK